MTICSLKKECIFSTVGAGLASAQNNTIEIKLKIPGKIILENWNKIPERFENIIIDDIVIMPNHFHGIILKENVGAGPCACPDHDSDMSGATTGSRPYDLSLSDVIECFKSLTTHNYLERIDKYNWQPFNGKFWQRGFYDRIIRNDNELKFDRYYIKTNPENWEKDEYFV